MKYNHAMAEREYKREWKAAKLEMRKAGMQRKQIREAARAYRLEFNGERRFYRRTDYGSLCGTPMRISELMLHWFDRKTGQSFSVLVIGFSLYI